MTKISIIIPVYNTAEYVGRCIDSVLEQKDVDVECIVVDDCGTDEALDIVFRYTDNRIKIVRHDRNRGLSAARNSGTAAACGDWIFYLDSDDALASPCALKNLVDMVTPQTDWVQGSFRRKATERQWQTIYPQAHYTSHGEIAASYSEINLTNAANKLINKTLAKSFPFREGLIFEDTLWCQQIYPHLRDIAVSDVPTYAQNVREGSIMQSSFSTVKAESQLYIIEQIAASNPDINQQQTLTYIALNLIKNIYMGDFSGKYRKEILKKLKTAGVFSMKVDRKSLPPFTKILSLLFGVYSCYYNVMCQAYKSFCKITK